MKIATRNVDEIIEALGGDVEAAKFFEITRQGVANYRKKKHIPNARMLHLKSARPDLFELKLKPRRSLDQSVCDSRTIDMFEHIEPSKGEDAS